MSGLHTEGLIGVTKNFKLSDGLAILSPIHFGSLFHELNSDRLESLKSTSNSLITNTICNYKLLVGWFLDAMPTGQILFENQGTLPCAATDYLLVS